MPNFCRTLRHGFGLLSAGIALSSGANANPFYSLGIRGEVPLICRAELTIEPADDVTGEVTAKLDEFCNSASGYRVYATPSGPAVRVKVDGNYLVAEPDGRYLISSTRQPGAASRLLQLTNASGETIRVTVVPS